MAIKRNFARPVIQVDCVIAGVERDTFSDTDDATGEVKIVDRGRQLLLVTAKDAPELVVKVPKELDKVDFKVGAPALLNVEYNEWDFTDDTGRRRQGSTMKLHSLVEANQFDRWKGVVSSQSGQAAAVEKATAQA